jgi:hypothetical protein
MNLALPLVALSLVLQAPATQSGEMRESNWSVAVRKDPITDREIGSASLMSVDGRSRLSFACNGIVEPVLSLQFRSADFLGVTPNAVVVRVDQGDILPATAWDYQDRFAYTSDPAWLSLFEQVIDANEHRIVIRALDYNDQPHDGIFVSKNAGKAMAQMHKICSVPGKTGAH